MEATGIDKVWSGIAEEHEANIGGGRNQNNLKYLNNQCIQNESPLRTLINSGCIAVGILTQKSKPRSRHNRPNHNPRFRNNSCHSVIHVSSLTIPSQANRVNA